MGWKDGVLVEVTRLTSMTSGPMRTGVPSVSDGTGPGRFSPVSGVN
jgi:hypothetical protein